MIIEQAALKQLKDTVAIAALVGTRIYCVKAPQDVTAPYIILNTISSVPVKPNFAAGSGRNVNRLQLSIIDTTYKSCKDIAAAVQLVLDDFQGNMSGFAVGGCFLDNQYDLPFEDSPLQFYGIGADYLIHY